MLSGPYGGGTRSETGCLLLDSPGAMRRSVTWPAAPWHTRKEVAQSRKSWSRKHLRSLANRVCSQQAMQPKGHSRQVASNVVAANGV